MHTLSIIGSIFKPNKPAEIDFKATIDAVNTQRWARITKAALFTLSSITTTVAFVLTEASIIAWPLALPIIGVTLVAGALFYRLNSLDKKYIEHIDDATRANVVKNELECIFHGKQKLRNEEIAQSLKNINRVLGNRIFDKDRTNFILQLNGEVNRSLALKSLSEIAEEQMVSMDFSCSSEWIESGWFGLPSYKRCFSITWSSTPGNIAVAYSSDEVTEGDADFALPDA